MSMLDDFRQIRDGFRSNPVQFVAIMGGLVAYIVGLATLMVWVDHPQTAGSTCQRKCMIEAYWFSPHLLRGGVTEWLTFLLLWLMPATFIGFLAYSAKKRKLRNPFSNSNSPSE